MRTWTLNTIIEIVSVSQILKLGNVVNLMSLVNVQICDMSSNNFLIHFKCLNESLWQIFMKSVYYFVYEDWRLLNCCRKILNKHKSLRVTLWMDSIVVNIDRELLYSVLWCQTMSGCQGVRVSQHWDNFIFDCVAGCWLGVRRWQSVSTRPVQCRGPRQSF